eukprot:6176782-Pleurochrysis_carterae.AAC.2
MIYRWSMLLICKDWDVFGMLLTRHGRLFVPVKLLVTSERSRGSKRSASQTRARYCAAADVKVKVADATRLPSMRILVACR